jgi:heterodisulfide reductase subunit A-like polyferredoxin
MGRGVGLEPAPVAPTQASSTTDAVAALPQADAADTALTRERVRLVAVVGSPDACTLCEACLDACSRGAISLNETAEVDAARCIGCGDCEAACPNNVFELAAV